MDENESTVTYFNPDRYRKFVRRVKIELALLALAKSAGAVIFVAVIFFTLSLHLNLHGFGVFFVSAAIFYTITSLAFGAYWLLYSAYKDVRDLF